MGVVIVIGVLFLLVTHAAAKASTLEVEVKTSSATPNLPPNMTVPATGANPTPSPATASGSPTAASSAIVRLDTNSKFAMPNPAFYAVSMEQAGLAGVPLPQVPGRQFNGYNAVPARTKQLLTAAPAPATTNSVNAKASSGDVQYIAGSKL